MKYAIYFVMIIFFVATSFAQYEENTSVMDNGGGKTTSASHENLASIGQSVMSMSSGGAYHITSGFIGVYWDADYYDIHETPHDNPKLPDAFTVGEPSPNPFNAVTRLNIEIPSQANMAVSIFDISGRCVYTENTEVKGGYYYFDFDAGELPSGTYLYNISWGSDNHSGKMTLIK